jgi:DNA-binding GntR family transcriptional regulator
MHHLDRESLMSVPVRRFAGPVVVESTPSIIARKLREAISAGRIAPGSRLGEAELARELGVSRGPLREAMQRLSQEGLLVSIRNRGLFVIELTDDDVGDIFVARAAVERAAVAQVMASDPADAARHLLDVIDVMARAFDDGDSERMAAADIAFHELLVELSGSLRLARMHKTLLTETRMCIHALRETYRQADDRVAEHRAIADAVAADDVGLADRLLVEHMDDALKRLTGG